MDDLSNRDTSDRQNTTNDNPFATLGKLTQTMGQQGYRDAKWSVTSDTATANQSQSQNGFTVTITAKDRNGSDLNRSFTGDASSPQTVSETINQIHQEFSRQPELAE